MKKPIERKQGFTLIELLMVIGIIGILAGILMPAVGLVRERAIIASSRARISQYMSAIQSFKGEYGYYPFSTLLDGSDGKLDLSELANSKAFYETLSARDIDDPSTPVQTGGNRRGIQFYEFAPEELSDESHPDIAENMIVDGFGNNQIMIVFDHDNDGIVEVPDPEGATSDTKEIRVPLTAYVVGNDEIRAPAYYLYE